LSEELCQVWWTLIGYAAAQVFLPVLTFPTNSNTTCTQSIILTLHKNMSKQKEPSEGDIIFNRANVALAKHQRLVASWLPPKTEAELANTKSQEELDREEEEMFAPVPELLATRMTNY
jgi:hypothetical protein